MKNQLENWEVGLAEKLRTEEFPFDPRAFAEFEGLLTAENVGTPERLADEYGVMTGKTTSAFSSVYIKLFLFGLVAVSGIGYLYFSRETATSNALPENFPQPEFSVPVPTEPDFDDEVSVLLNSKPGTIMTDIIRQVPGVIPISSPSKVAMSPIESLKENKEEVPVTAEEKVLTRQTVLIHSLPMSAVTPLSPRSPAFKIPAVSLSGNTTLKPRRNRRTLFPDVIE